MGRRDHKNFHINIYKHFVTRFNEQILMNLGGALTKSSNFSRVRNSQENVKKVTCLFFT